VTVVWVADLDRGGRLAAAGCDEHGFAGGETLEAAGVNGVLVAASAGASAAGVDADECVVCLLGGDPDGLGAGDTGDQLCGLGYVLAVREKRGDVPEDLLA
jgi:hypothetical protein